MITSSYSEKKGEIFREETTFLKSHVHSILRPRESSLHTPYWSVLVIQKRQKLIDFYPWDQDL